MEVCVSMFPKVMISVPFEHPAQGGGEGSF